MYGYDKYIKIFDENSKKEKNTPEITGPCFVDKYTNTILLCTYDLNTNCNPYCSACNSANDNGRDAYMCKRGKFKIGMKM